MTELTECMGDYKNVWSGREVVKGFCDENQTSVRMGSQESEILRVKLCRPKTGMYTVTFVKRMTHCDYVYFILLRKWGQQKNGR